MEVKAYSHLPNSIDRAVVSLCLPWNTTADNRNKIADIKLLRQAASAFGGHLSLKDSKAAVDAIHEGSYGYLEFVGVGASSKAAVAEPFLASTGLSVQVVSY